MATPPILDRIPDVIIAGDTYKWKVAQGDYVPATWTLQYYFVRTGSSVSLTGGEIVDNGDGTWTVTMSATKSTALADNERYQFQGVVNDGTQYVTINSGTVQVVPGVREHGTGIDIRSDARKNLEAIDAVLTNKAGTDRLAYSIAGRSLTEFSWGELIDARAYYAKQVAREVAKERAGRGLSSGRRVLARFTNP
jgi:hypothetical protein